jgi:hypothetical protein
MIGSGPTTGSTDDPDGADGILGLVLTLIILVPATREHPRFFAHAVLLEMSPRARSTHKRKSSDALPVHMVRSFMSAHTQVAIGSVWMIVSMATLRFAGLALDTAERKKNGSGRADR